MRLRRNGRRMRSEVEMEVKSMGGAQSVWGSGELGVRTVECRRAEMRVWIPIGPFSVD